MPSIKFLYLNSVFVRSGPEMVPQIKYFRTFSTDFNKQVLKLKLITQFLILRKKFFFFLRNFEIFTNKNIFSVSIFFFNSVFFRHICSILSFETYYFSIKQNSNKLSVRRSLYPIFFNFRTLNFLIIFFPNINETSFFVTSCCLRPAVCGLNL